MYLGIALSSDSEGEAEVALRQMRKLIKAENIAWHDVVAAVEQRAVLGKLGEVIERARALKTERDAALAEVDRLTRLQADGHSNSFAAQLWQTPGMPLTVDNRTAKWVLDLVAQGRHQLTPKELGLCQSCAMRRNLSEKQRNWLRDIIQVAVARTGLTPPP